MTDEATELPVFTLEKGIPVPDGVIRPYKRWHRLFPWHEMEVGDSFLVPYEEGQPGTATQNRVNAAAIQFRKRYAKGQAHVSRQLPEGVRCWRTR